MVFVNGNNVLIFTLLLTNINDEIGPVEAMIQSDPGQHKISRVETHYSPYIWGG